MVQEVYPGSDMEGGRAMRRYLHGSSKDPKIEEDAIQQIMQLAIYGVIMKPRPEEDLYTSLEDVLKLFKDAGLIK